MFSRMCVLKMILSFLMIMDETVEYGKRLSRLPVMTSVTFSVSRE